MRAPRCAVVVQEPTSPPLGRGGDKGTMNWVSKDSKVGKACKSTGAKGGRAPFLGTFKYCFCSCPAGPGQNLQKMIKIGWRGISALQT